ncbi:hypothetical protein BDW71DRAFT_200860 [Aspergillus fruticulosus]
MDQPTHIIDPDGEVIILLRNANSPFADPSEEMVSNGLGHPIPEPNNDIQNAAEEIEHSEEFMGMSKPTFRGKGKKKKKRYNNIRAPLEPISPPIEEPCPAPEETPPAEPPVAEEPVAEDPVAEDPVPKEPVPEESAYPLEPAETGVHGQQEETCFRIQVSAKHLTLASPVFKKILTGGWKESVTYLRKGSVEITAESWDLEALLVLLRSIHCQNHHMPRKLTLEMLAKVAVLADYYDCREAIDILGHIWINALEEAIPLTYCRDLILWLWVSWFFQLPAHFKQATSTAMSCSNNRIDSLGLPIPYDAINFMNDRRQEGIAGIVFLLQEKREELRSGRRGCGFECSSIMYGALTKQMQSNALLRPRPTALFPGLNYKSLVRRVSSFTSPRWYGPSSCFDTYGHHCRDSSFESLFGRLNDTIKGLDLDSLLHK